MMNTGNSKPNAIDEFHAHLDVCERCRTQCFNPCPVGARLLVAAAMGVSLEVIAARPA